MRVPSAGRRRLSTAIAVASLCAVSSLLVHERDATSFPVGRPAVAPLDDAGYVAVASHLQERIETLWSPRLGRYASGPGASTSIVNADLLLVHAVAAQRGLDGPLRA